MKRIINLTAAAAFMLAVGAQADLGDSDQISARKYMPMPHDTNFDAVGKDGLLHSTDDVWHYYFDKAGNTIGHVYDNQGVAIAVLYRLKTGYYSWSDVVDLIERNNLSSSKEYWIRLPDFADDAVFASRDGNYFLYVEYADIEHHERNFTVFVWTVQAYKAIHQQ